MMRKWVIAAIAVLVVSTVVLIAVLNINSLISRNREYLLARAQEALGRPISAGAIELTLWSGLGLRARDFIIADDPAFSAGDFVRARDVQVQLKLLPLFRSRFEIKKIVLHEPVITIIRNPAGLFNFTSLGEEESVKDPKKDRNREKRDRPTELRIALADISNGELIYLDQKQPGNLHLRQVDLALKQTTKDSVSVTLQAALFGSKPNLTVKATVARLAEKDWRQLPVDGEISFDPLDLNQLHAAVPFIRSALPKDFSAAGLLSLNRLQLKGTAGDFTFNGAVNGTNAAIAFGSAFQKAAGLVLEVTADGRYAKDALELRKADVKLHRAQLTAKGQVGFGNVPALNLSVDTKPFPLTGFDAIFPLLQEYQLSGDMEAHAAIRGKLAKGVQPRIEGNLILSGISSTPPQLNRPVKDLSAKVGFAGRRASIREGTVTIGGANIRWSGTIESFSPLRLTYDLSTPELRPADFQRSGGESRSGDVLRNFASQGELTMEAGRLALAGKISSSEGGLFNIAYQQLESSVAVANNVFTVRGLRMHALRGALLADGEFVLHDVPRFTLTSKIQGIDINESYRSFTAQEQRDIRGRLNAHLKITGSGRSWDEIKPNVRGQGDADVVDGALLNFNLVDATLSGTGIPGVKSFISPQVRKKYPDTFESKDTKFKELRARFDIAAGRVQVKDLQVAAADYSMQGDGWVDFERRVDFRSSLMLSQRLSADLAQSTRELKFLFNEQSEVQIPFTVTGTMPNVKTRPDANYLAKALQRGFLGEGVEQLERRLFGKKNSAPERNAGQPADDSRRQRRRDTEDLIRRGLEGLLRRN